MLTLLACVLASWARVIWTNVNKKGRCPDQPVFISEREQPLTRSGSPRIIERVCEAAKIEASRYSPHTFRYAFAIEFPGAGGNSYSCEGPTCEGPRRHVGADCSAGEHGRAVRRTGKGERWQPAKESCS